MTEYYKNKSLKTLPNEIWKDIDMFDGMYEISNFGRVKRKERTVFPSLRKLGIKILAQKVRTRELTGSTCTVRIYIDKKRYCLLIKRLVMKAFSKEIPKKYIFNIDGDITNNCINNLMYGDEDAISNRLSEKNHTIGKFSSKYKGVSIINRDTGRKYYISCIYYKNKLYKKYYPSELEAAHGYDKFLLEFNLKRKGNFINK